MNDQTGRDLTAALRENTAVQRDRAAATRENTAALLALRGAIEKAKPKRAPSRNDRAKLEALLPLIGPEVKIETYSMRTLHIHAKRVAKFDPKLLAALQAIGSPRTVGRLLARGAGHDIAGYRITVVGEDRDGLLYECGEVSPQKPAKPTSALTAAESSAPMVSDGNTVRLHREAAAPAKPGERAPVR